MKNRKIILIIVFIISLILIGIGIFLSLKGEYNTNNENNEVDNGEVIVDYNINYYNSVDEAINYIKAIRNTENVNIINEDKSYSLDNGENLIPSRVIGKANKK